MRKEKKWVYYCDFCKKRGLRSLKIHEAHCTLNPQRSCRLCKSKFDYPDLVNKLKFTTEEGEWPGNHYKIQATDLMDPVEGCPICALTILRLFMRGKSDGAWGFGTDFNFKDELNRWWAAENEEAQRREMYGD